MKVTSVTTHYERKLNTGDYSSVTLGTWATVELEDGDTEEYAMAHAMELCRTAVKDAAVPFLKNGATPAPVTQGEQFGGLKVKREPSGPGGLNSYESEAARSLLDSADNY